MPDALRTIAATVAAGVCQPWHTRNDASGYGPNFDSTQGVGAAMQQGSKCQWDPTPWRAYDGYLVHNGGYNAGTVTLDLDTGVQPILPGMVLSFQSTRGRYVIINGIPAGGTGTITIDHGLEEGVPDNTPVRLHKRGERIWHFGHSHTAQTNSWPSWTCWPADSDVWVSPAAYRHINLANSSEDPYLIDIIGEGNFHQDGGTAFNPAKQLFYRALPQGNPTIILRINCDEYDPLDIGGFTDFALTGNGVKFTEGSKTVEGDGTSFLTQFPARTLDTFGSTRGGYQLWPNGVDLMNGLSQRIVTVDSVTNNTQLQLISAYDGTTTGFVASTGHDAYDLISHWGFEPGASFTLGNANACPAIEYWPERDALIFLRGVVTGQAVYEKRTDRGDSAAWTVLVDVDDGFDPSSGGTYICGGLTMHAHYNTKRGSMLLLIGRRIPPNTSDGDDGAAVYEITINNPLDPLGAVTLTELDPIPFPIYVNNSTGGIATHDPVSGKYLFIAGKFDPDLTPRPDLPRVFAELDPDAAAGTQITLLDGSIFPDDMSSDTSLNGCHNLINCVPYNIGVIYFAGKNGDFVYKHTANSWATDGMSSAEKEAGIPGLMGSTPFGDGWVPKYFWDQNQTAEDSAFAAAVAGLTHEGGNANLNIECWSAHANAPRTDSGNGVCKPEVVTDIKYAGEGGSLRFEFKNQTGMTTGEGLWNIDGTDGTGANSTMISPTTAARSTKIYMRYPMRVNSVMLGPLLEHISLVNFVQGGASTAAPDSPIVNIEDRSSDTSWTGAIPAWVGKKVYVDWSVGTENIWRYGFYTIESVQSTTQFTLNTSPTFSGQQGTANGTLWIQPDADKLLAGTKVVILHGNPPNGASASQSIETTTLRLQRATSAFDDYTEGYGMQGRQGFPCEGFGGPMLADTWHVFEVEVDIRPTARDFYTDSAGSLVVGSDTITFPTALETFGMQVYFNGYGRRSYTVGASPWVPGLYTVTSVNTTTNKITLNASPTPTAPGTDGVGYIATGDTGAFVALGSNRFRLWQDGILCVQSEISRMNFGAFAQPYGYGRVSVSNAANWRDTTQVHDTGYTYFGHFLFSTQPIPFETASASAPEPPPSGNLIMPWTIQP